jgi:hypothetical protein
MSLHDQALAAAIDEFRKTKTYAEKAFAQLADDDFFFRLNDQQSSISAYIRHLAGNMQSRWSDFLTSDGEKLTRNREAEFIEQTIPRAQLLAIWESGWATLFAALQNLKPGDLEKTVQIRNEPHSVIQAIIRQIAHYTWHIGQIVLLAKHIKTSRGQAWNYMTIAPGKSGEFNKQKGL